MASRSAQLVLKAQEAYYKKQRTKEDEGISTSKGKTEEAERIATSKRIPQEDFPDEEVARLLDEFHRNDVA